MLKEITVKVKLWVSVDCPDEFIQEQFKELLKYRFSFIEEVVVEDEKEE